MKACLPSNQCTVPENTKLLQDLIISLETFKKKKRAEHIAQAGVEKPQKGIRHSGISREGKGKRFGKGKLGMTTTSHLSARCKLASNSTIGIQDKLLCSVEDYICLFWHFISCCYMDQSNVSG